MEEEEREEQVGRRGKIWMRRRRSEKRWMGRRTRRLSKEGKGVKKKKELEEV